MNNLKRIISGILMALIVVFVLLALFRMTVFMGAGL